jgi:hypothetical protein
MENYHVSSKRRFFKGGSYVDLKVHNVEVDFVLDESENIISMRWDFMLYQGHELRSQKYVEVLAWLVPCRSSMELYRALEWILEGVEV